MLATTAVDAHGNPITGDAVAITRYDVAIDRLVRYDEAIVELMTTLASDEPGFPMGQALAAWLALTSTDVPDLEFARQSADQMRALSLNAREAAHLAAIDAWAAGRWHRASRLLDDLLVQWPTDLLALLIGHQLDFYLGDAANLRDRVGRSLLSYDRSDPHFAILQGMHAFGLEESGTYGLAERSGLAAVAGNPDDVWAIHAVAHVYEMQGRVDDGLRFLGDRDADWGAGNLFMVHLWWHRALYLLEAGRPDDALALYDAHVHHAGSAGVPLEMLDASALLWRLHLEGVDTGDRFGALADAWATRTGNEPWYAFNDLHAVMAFVGAGRHDEAAAVITRLEHYVATADPSLDNVAMTAEVGLPTARAALAYGQGRDADVVTALAPIRRVVHHFGGSHAQRDAVQRTLLTAAIRSGDLDLAGALVSERLSVRETSVYAWRKRAEILAARGDTRGAAEATTAAQRHQDRFDAALG